MTAPIPYADARKRIQDGDLIFCRGRRPWHWGIRKFTGGEVNHAAFLFHWGAVVLIVESGERGVVAIPASTFIRVYPGEVYWGRCDKVTYTDAQIMRDAVIRKLFERYATWAMLRFAARKALRRTAKLLGIKWEPPQDARWYCSEIVAYGLSEVGLTMPFDTEGAITPQAIADHKSVRILGRLVE